MKIETLQKWGGISLITGAILLAIYSIGFVVLLPVGEIKREFILLVLNPNWIWITSVAFIGVIFMAFGLTAVYSRLFERAGIIGLFGYLLMEIAYILQAGKVTWEIFLYPVIAMDKTSAGLLNNAILKNSSLVVTFGTISTLIIFSGMVLFCYTLLRSCAFPRIAGVLIFVGALFYGVGPALSVFVSLGGIVLFAGGCCILGVGLMRPATVGTGEA